MGVNQHLLKFAELLKPGITPSLQPWHRQKTQVVIPALKMQLGFSNMMGLPQKSRIEKLVWDLCSPDMAWRPSFTCWEGGCKQ